MKLQMFLYILLTETLHCTYSKLQYSRSTIQSSYLLTSYLLNDLLTYLLNDLLNDLLT